MDERSQLDRFLDDYNWRYSNTIPRMPLRPLRYGRGQRRIDEAVTAWLERELAARRFRRWLYQS